MRDEFDKFLEFELTKLVKRVWFLILYFQNERKRSVLLFGRTNLTL